MTRLDDDAQSVYDEVDLTGSGSSNSGHGSRVNNTRSDQASNAPVAEPQPVHEGTEAQNQVSTEPDIAAGQVEPEDHSHEADRAEAEVVDAMEIDNPESNNGRATNRTNSSLTSSLPSQTTNPSLDLPRLPEYEWTEGCRLSCLPRLEVVWEMYIESQVEAHARGNDNRRLQTENSRLRSELDRANRKIEQLATLLQKRKHGGLRQKVVSWPP